MIKYHSTYIIVYSITTPFLLNFNLKQSFMKRQLTNLLLLCVSLTVLSTTIISCGVKDETVKTSVETLLKANPELAGIVADVKEGVITLSGEVKSEAAKAAAETALAGVKGMKSIANNITIAAPPPAPIPDPATIIPAADEALNTGLKDVLKDFSGLTSSVKDGMVSLTGEITKAKWLILKQAIDKLTPKGYELAGLKIK